MDNHGRAILTAQSHNESTSQTQLILPPKAHVVGQSRSYDPEKYAPRSEPWRPVVDHQPTVENSMKMTLPDPLNVYGLPKDENCERGWSHDLLDVTGDGRTFCASFWCPCFVYAGVRSRQTRLDEIGRPHPNGGGQLSSVCVGHGLASLFCLGWFFQMDTRAHIRERYDIRGNTCSDCATGVFCTPCELTQESRELALEERRLMGDPGYAPSTADYSDTWDGDSLGACCSCGAALGCCSDSSRCCTNCMWCCWS